MSWLRFGEGGRHRANRDGWEMVLLPEGYRFRIIGPYKRP